MATRANMAWQLRHMWGAPVSSVPQPIFETTDGILIGYSNITTGAALDAYDDGSMANGCLMICAVGSAENTVRLLVNESSTTAPSFKSIMEDNDVDPDV